MQLFRNRSLQRLAGLPIDLFGETLWASHKPQNALVIKKADVAIRPYAEDDLRILERTLTDPRMMNHLGGPENDDKLRGRHKKFVAMSLDPSLGCMFVIVAGGEDVGTVGYWERDQEGGVVWETGWMVVPEFQRRGIATESMQLLIKNVAQLDRHRYLYAFPSVENLPSNAICRRLGFELEKEEAFEYPPGSGKVMRCNNWRLDLSTRET
ncbi:MAG TPA: GNAT family N-acetyltransferase [Nitrososphaerales archaeon]|nr:GNAT family N-acetyltransferase [Nitrososphaerales archaeon]